MNPHGGEHRVLFLFAVGDPVGVLLDGLQALLLAVAVGDLIAQAGANAELLGGFADLEQRAGDLAVGGVVIEDRRDALLDAVNVKGVGRSAGALERQLAVHAEAEGNVFRRIHGQYNSLITQNGLRQIRALQNRFEDVPVDAVYASDLYRTCKTAESVYLPKKLELRRDPRFREVALGVWEDTPFGYLEKFEREDMWAFNHDPLNWHVEGSETYAEYTGRFLEALRQAAEENDGRTIAVFTHGCVLRGVQFILSGQETVPYCDNTAVSLLHYSGGQFEIEYLNDNTHLDESISTFARQKWWREKSDTPDHNMGGIDASIVDRKDSTEEIIRAETRRACETYAPGGHYMPCITYGGPGCLFKHVDPIIDSEIARYNHEVYKI